MQINKSKVRESITNLTKANKIHIKGIDYSPSTSNKTLRESEYSYQNLTNLKLMKTQSANV